MFKVGYGPGKYLRKYLPLFLAILLGILSGCRIENIAEYSKLKVMVSGHNNIVLESSDSIRIDGDSAKNISELKDSAAISTAKLMKKMGVISFTHFGNAYEFSNKSGYEFSEGLIYVGTKDVSIIHYDQLEKVGNDGWFWYQKTYTHYRQ